MAKISKKIRTKNKIKFNDCAIENYSVLDMMLITLDVRKAQFFLSDEQALAYANENCALFPDEIMYKLNNVIPFYHGSHIQIDHIADFVPGGRIPLPVPEPSPRIHPEFRKHFYYLISAVDERLLFQTLQENFPAYQSFQVPIQSFRTKLQNPDLFTIDNAQITDRAGNTYPGSIVGNELMYAGLEGAGTSLPLLNEMAITDRQGQSHEIVKTILAR